MNSQIIQSYPSKNPLFHNKIKPQGKEDGKRAENTHLSTIQLPL